jgi:very-short-patch-repair endonuclease
MESDWLSAKQFRRLLRHRSTDAERRLWSLVRGKRFGTKFRRQHSVAGFVLDFFSPETGLAIEVDGGQHFEETHWTRDRARDASLVSRGIEVIRFTDRDVLLGTDAVAEVIWHAVQRRLRREASHS